MNRWPFSSQASEEQASQRNQRAARRTIRSQQQVQSDSDEENFRDAENSFNASLNLDGEPNEPEEPDMADEAARRAALVATEMAKPFDKRNLPDDAEAWKKEIKIQFDITDVKYWFNSVEGQMRKFGINLQWSKKDAILPLLPAEVIEECKPILRLDETEAGPEIYFDLKKEIMKRLRNIV